MFTGCDTVSAFATKGKKTPWETWKGYDMATEAFVALSKAPKQIPEEVISIVKHFTIIFYDCTGSQVNIDQARLELFTKKEEGWSKYLQLSRPMHWCSTSKSSVPRRTLLEPGS